MTKTVPIADAVLAGSSLMSPVREEPPGSNRGQMVEAMQRATGGSKGDPWCADDVAYVGSGVLKGCGLKWPLRMTGSCEQLRQDAKTKGVLVTQGPPRRGMVFLLIESNGRAGHTGFVVNVLANGSFDTREGNTTAPSSSKESLAQTREGWGHFDKLRGPGVDKYTYEFIDWEALV